MNPNDKTDEEFEWVWESADWMFKNDKQDAKYFFLRGQQVEIVKQQLREAEQMEKDRNAIHK